MIKNLKKNDKVITKGGLIGKVIEFQGKNQQYIIIDNEVGTKIKLQRNYISSIIDNNKV